MARFSHIISAIDAHTAGEPTRIVLTGLPPIPVNTMAAKKRYMKGQLSAWVPLIDLTEHHRKVGADAPATAAVPQTPENQVVIVERPVTLDDVPKLSGLALADFAIDFSPIEEPQAGDLDTVALQAYADNLCKQAGLSL